MAVNPSLAFRVETSAPTENFKPRKAYRTRIKWCDANGNEQNKLLVMEPETVVAELLQRGVNRAMGSERAPRRPQNKKRGPRNAEEARAK